LWLRKHRHSMRLKCDADLDSASSFTQSFQNTMRGTTRSSARDRYWASCQKNSGQAIRRDDPFAFHFEPITCVQRRNRQRYLPASHLYVSHLCRRVDGKNGHNASYSHIDEIEYGSLLHALTPSSKHKCDKQRRHASLRGVLSIALP